MTDFSQFSFLYYSKSIYITLGYNGSFFCHGFLTEIFRFHTFLYMNMHMTFFWSALIFKIIAADTMIFKIIVRQTSFQIQAHMRHKVLNMVT